MRGGSCRKSGRPPREAFDLRVTPDEVRIEIHGRLVRTLTGTAAAELRRALEAHDEAAVDRLVARNVR
jgi:hypothetical protein